MDEDDEEQPCNGVLPDGAAKKKKSRKKKKKAKDAEADGAGDLLDAGEEDGFEPQPLPQEEDWVDITQTIQAAVQGMNLGEMVESPHFRLFDAMSAIEIMDPKMDSGFNNGADMTLDRAEETGILVKAMPPEDLVAICDHLLMFYLMWLEGHTVVQTCFSCLYLQDLQRHVQPLPVFGAFVDAFLVACRKARDAVLHAGIFDDEDFQPSMFGIELEACVFSADTGEVTQRLNKERKSLGGGAVAKAAAARLAFIGEYMLALTALTAEASLGQRRLDGARQRLTECLRLLDQIREPPPAASPDVLRCFDASFNRKLLVPGPPRTVEPITDRAVVVGMWTSHVHELLACCDILNAPLVQALDGAIRHKGEPNVLARSIAQIVASEDGHMRKLMLDGLALYLFPQEAVQHCRKPVDAFLQHAESLFSHLLKLAHASCARRFRRLAHVFSDFNSLQHEAWQLDEDLKQTFGANLRYPRPCWVWVLEHCLQVMITKLLLGFDLDLYDDVEFHMIYWYVDYLYGLRIYNLNELYHAKEQPIGGPKKKAGARQPDKAGPRAAGSKPRNPPPSLLLLEATQATVRGLFRLLAFCLRLGLTRAPAAAADGLAKRFVLRFRSLENFRLPHLPSYRDFEVSSVSAQAPSESRVVLDAAQASFTESAQMLERLGTAIKDRPPADDRDKAAESAKTLKRVVVANQLAVTQLIRLVDAGDLVKRGTKVTALPTHHPHLVSVQVQTTSP